MGEGFALNVELILAHQEAKNEENWTLWEDFRNGEIAAVKLVPLQSTAALVSRKELFAGNLPSAAAKSSAVNGKLIKILLGKTERSEQPALHLNQISQLCR